MRALIVEDNPADVRLIRELLRQADSPERIEVESVDRLSAAVDRLGQGGIDIILLDLGLPDSQGIETFARVREAAREVPLVVLTGLADDVLALRTIREGAQDYLVKGHIDGHSLVREARFAVERKRAEFALRESGEQMKLLLDSTTEAICGMDTEGCCTFLNQAAARVLGYSGVDSLLGRDMHALVHHTRADGTLYPKEDCPIHNSVSRGEKIQSDSDVFWRADGASFPVEYRCNPVFRDGKVIGGVVSFEDLTNRRQVEALSEERRRLATFSTSLGKAITRGGSLREILSRCTDEMVQHLDAAFARIWTLDVEDMTLVLQASSGMYTHVNGPHGRVPVGKYKIGRIAAEMKPHLTNDVLHDSNIGDPEWARRERMVAFAGHPLVVEGELVGVMAMFARHALSDFTLRALASAADSVSLFVKRKKADLSLEHAEERLRQSQKMEALGRLAGGVAHDFNNVLTAILGYGELAMTGAAPGSALAAQLGEIHKAAERAAGLTRQLLAFGRRQVVQPRVLDVNVVIQQFQGMLRRMIDESIQLDARLDPEIGHVRTDPGQIEQILMNLTVNARDAMPTGGVLSIDTANADLDEAYTRLHAGLAPGSYVMISVSDAGIGMSPETLSRVFEPFFTTKEQGKGTGLGLSTVYGIVKQSGGCIWAYSELGQGTTFKVFLPRVNEPLDLEDSRVEAPSFYRGTECVLLVEDDEAVRALARAVLEQQGYTVVEAPDPQEAIELARSYESAIDLLLTDVIMPRMSGRDLAARVTEILPEVRVLYMSGYARHLMTNQGVLEAGVDFLEKPFTPQGLACKVREVLEKSMGDAPANQPGR